VADKGALLEKEKYTGYRDFVTSRVAIT